MINYQSSKLRAGSLYFHLLLLLPLWFAFVACSSSRNTTKNFVYFNEGPDTVSARQIEISIQPNDLLSIQVFSKTLNQEQAAIFNMPDISKGAEAVHGYQVSPDGTIEMPVIGKVTAAGLSKSQLQTALIQKLTEYVKNPSVIVRFLQFNVNVLGEVHNPGTQKFSIDRVTVIDALSAAGDLTDFGKRENITVIREDGEKKFYYTIDISKKDLFNSPAFLLKPNDIVYVAPTKNKLRTLDRNPNAEKATSIFFSILSTVVGVASIVIWATK